MSMDALTQASLESLAQEILPRLAERLAEFRSIPPEQRSADPELKTLIDEAHELLSLMSGWLAAADPASAAVASETASELEAELSDDDAMALLAAEGADETEALVSSGSVADSLDDSTDADESDLGDMDPETMAMLQDAEAGEGSELAAGSDELSDDEALALLDGLEGDEADSSDPMSEAAPEAKPVATDAAEMSDDEAMAMLAAMDEPLADEGPAAPVAAGGDDGDDGEMSDDEAMAMLANMDAPLEEDTSAAPVVADGGEMSDDEAMAMLADMDAPLEASAPAAPGAADDGEMSDEEAMAMLAAMDAPAEDTADPMAAAPDEDQSADDEAMALLASMGGLDGDDVLDEPAPVAAATPAASAAPAAAGGATDSAIAAIGEINEFSDNDFASDPEMMNDFHTNTEELMETLDETVLQLEQNPTDREVIEAIFRAAHTLKGAAGMFGFKAIERVMHRMENLFDLVRKGKLVPNADTIDVVFQGLDVLRELLEAVKNGSPSGKKTAPIVHALELASRGEYVAGSVSTAPEEEASAPPAVTGGVAAPEPEAASGGGSGGSGGQAAKKKDSSTIRVDLERLDALVNLVGELVIDRTRFVSIEEEFRSKHPGLDLTGHMSETVQLFGRHMNDVHEIVMKIRMVPIGNAFNKFPRIVRDLARQLGKDINLFIDGEETELDKTLVEQIGDPLIHLIRNSCDHGVETPEVRQASGKSPGGQVYLGARQEGNHIIITIEDDGKGMDAEIIRKKGIERGLISEEDVLSNRDIFNLIFEPGFSTAEQVTNVSGRGVGMDVVKKQISKLKGLIDIDSEVGRGTTITIQLPLTLAIVQSLLVQARSECFAIPLSSVVESVRISPDEIQHVGDTEVIKRHGSVLPLLHLADALNLAKKDDVSWYSQRPDQVETLRHDLRNQRREERLYVVIVGSGERRFGIVVDQLLNQQEMVIKSLGEVMKETPCVAGGAVLGNGEVVLVMDIQELEDQFRSKVRTNQAA